MAKVSIREVRQLMLPVETVVDAVLQLDRDRGGVLALGNLLGAQVESGEEPGMVLSVRLAGTGDVDHRRFALPEIAAAIINYCWQSRIPLPRHGTKALEIVSGGFTFTVETTSQLPRRHGALPPARVQKIEPVEQAAQPSDSPADAEELPDTQARAAQA
ncbi:MAG TPA: hypothetical protein VGN07_03025 [Steroidobacteraceae bacterium]|jgi:hypothetical protein